MATSFIVIRQGQHGNERLCNDGLYRHFAHLGTTPECVKFYRQKARAIRQARRNRQLEGRVVCFPADYQMNAVGDVFNELDQEVDIRKFTVYR